MDLFDFLNTPIDELYEQGILQEPEPERNILMCTLVATCSVCTNTYREDYRRQNVDRLIAGWHCPECHTPYSYKLISVTPYTTHYRSRNVHRASMRDDTSGQCWQCGVTGGRLLPYTFSCGEHISLCPDHFKRYHKHMYKLAQERASQERGNHE